ncbi:Rhodanese-like domain-containing protein [Lipomyces kononenkoae]|uniref:Rhodanese-like domain-containing protein n=1 Tax=Lipomyces kononenkoae TaxID=34357 RepID=A0ACC3SZL5_LIPKO
MSTILFRSTRSSLRSVECGVWLQAARRYSLNGAYCRELLLRQPSKSEGFQNNTRQFIRPNYFQRFLSSDSEGFPGPKIYNYEDIKQLSLNRDEDKILVDVREPAELEQGFIPTAINIPYKSAPHALSLSEEDFEEQFGFQKPSKEKELIFYCLGGVRCHYAQELAGHFGYDKRGSYPGSWEDWVQRESPGK